ncbi:MAG: hypothetical protein HFH71_05340 [Clostridia bacterium]|nr:hypothetical protein [Clostridia bacterium]
MNSKELLSAQTAVEKASAKAQGLIDGIVDAGSFVETDAFVVGAAFDSAETALGEGVVTGYASIEGTPVHIFAQNADVMKGSIGAASAKKIRKCIERACKSGTPLISVLDCSGARVDEGVSVMEAYADIIAAAADASDSVPHICVVNGVAAGMSAAYASLADYIFMNKNAFMSVNSPMYHASKFSAVPKLNKIAGYEAYKSCGNVVQDVYSDSAELKNKIISLFNILNISDSDEQESEDDPNRIATALSKKYGVDAALKAVCDDGKYLSYCDGWADDVKCAFTKINGISTAVIATDSGVNDGYVSADGLDKICAFIAKSDAFGLPLVTLVDSKGVNPSLDEEVKGFSLKLAATFKAMATYSHPMIGVACGKAVGVAYSALMSKAVGFDYTLATAAAEIAPVTSETGVNVFYTEELKKGNTQRAKLEQMFATDHASPLTAAKDGYLDNVIDAKNLRPYLSSALMMLLGI